MSEMEPPSTKKTASRSGSGSSEKPSARQSSFSQSAPAAGASRHVACKACRERKVRCGGGHPNPCHGCQKRNQECIYPISRNSDAATEEISETIRTLATRLARAEAEIAGQKSFASTSPILTPGTTAAFNGLPPTGPGFPSTGSFHGAATSPTDFAAVQPLLSPVKDPESMGAVSQNVRDDLHTRYFESVQTPFPMIHKDRYMAKIHMAPLKEEISALMYAVLAHAAMSSPEYASVENICYRACRRHLEQAELRSHGGETPTLEVAQACLLVALYEFKRMHSTRAWLSTSRGMRIVQMLRLHQLNNTGTTTSPHDAAAQVISPQPTAHWVAELEEEGRRVFWVAFALDRFSNTGTDWPIMLDDAEISTLLPSPSPLEVDDAQRLNNPPSPSIQALLTGVVAPGLSSFAGVTLMAHLWGRCMTHLYSTSRSEPLGANPEITRDFWARHYDIDGTVTRVMNTCCAHLVLTSNLGQMGMSGFNSPVSADSMNPSVDPNALFVNLVAQTIVIYLHMAAVRQAKFTGLPPGVQNESETKCKVAAMQIAALVQRVPSPSIFAEMNFFAARCLDAAARVLIRTIKRLHGDARFFELLHCLLSVMNACKGVNPLVGFYLEQLSQDFEGDAPSDATFVPR